MRTAGFILFLSIALFIWAALNYYLFLRLSPILPKWFTTFFWILAFSYFIGRILEQFGVPSHILIIIGSIVMGIQVYLFLCFLFMDAGLGIAHLLKKPLGFPPKLEAISALAIALTVVLAGFINSVMPITRHVNIPAPKVGSELRIAFASDLHLGHIVGKGRAERLISMIEKAEPDIVLLGGDIIDEDVRPVKKKDMAAPFLELTSKYGVYAVTGNHEYIGGVEGNVEYLESRGIRFLRDDYIEIDGFIVAGREDASISSFTNKKRRSVKEILPESEKPVILLDHQPQKPAFGQGIFLQLSGHTHHGQMFPFNLITSLIYPRSHGYMENKDTHLYVSCGFGTWGPPLRLASRPELVIFDITN